MNMTTHGTFSQEELDAFGKKLIDRLLSLEVNWKLTRTELARLVGMEEAKLAGLISSPTSIIHAIRQRDNATWEPIYELVQIESLLDVLFADQNNRDSWIKKPNSEPRFGGTTALEFLLRDPTQNRAIVIGYLWGVSNCNFS